MNSSIPSESVSNSSAKQTLAWHTKDIENTLADLESDRTVGLTAEQAAQRLEQFGTNELEDKGGRSSWTIIIDQFKNVMLLMLIAVALVSGGISLLNDEFPKDAIAIMLIVGLNGVLGYLQESRAEKALAALQKMASPVVRVVRDGNVTDVEARALVPGDLMLLEAGMQVAADGRLIEAVNLQLRESALTGEAEVVNKKAQIMLPAETSIGDRLNVIFQGTDIAQGRGTAIVTNTGMATELGRIATLLQSVEVEPTPLQRRMTQLGNVLVSGSLILVALVVGLGVLQTGWSQFNSLLEVSLSMAVAVVPEGLPAVITVTLALGTQRMVRRHALIRKLPAVETLGSVTTICSDKTGTLTQNKMVVQAVRLNDAGFQVTGEGYSPEGEFFRNDSHFLESCSLPTNHDLSENPYDYPELMLLLMGCLTCNDAALQRENGAWAVIGDPTEGALLPLAGKAGMNSVEWANTVLREAELPFTSERKRMSVVVNDQKGWMRETLPALDASDLDASDLGASDLDASESGPENGNQYFMFTKGSPEMLLERCSQVQQGDRPESLSAANRSRLLEQNDQMAAQGLRVLGFAYKSVNGVPHESDMEKAESDLIWLGLVGMLDAPRPEVARAVKLCRQAGIRPVMITGDHQLTAQAIAQSLGIADKDSPTLTGNEIEKMSPDDLARQVNRVSVYARVAPEHKLRIVQALQGRGGIIAMTGDGVNDAPALKQADIGIAMGITGTDVSKEASDMVLLDDNFASIVAATEEGRVVYSNIRRFIRYILGSNIGEVLTIAASPILIPLGGVPLSPLQILWMNLVTDGLPALALAVEPAEPDVMTRPPYDPKESIFARGMGAYMVRIGIIFSIISIALMVWAYSYTQNTPGDPERWKTMVFTMLCLAQMGHAIAVRSDSRLIIEMNPISNPFVLGAVILTTILQLMLIYVAPLREFFGTHWLSLTDLLICVGFSSLLFVWVELEKIAIRLWHRYHS
ncbi:MAG: cation-translocating P-type ATPase [Elainellaceae cyanobacterium]